MNLESDLAKLKEQLQKARTLRTRAEAQLEVLEQDRRRILEEMAELGVGPDQLDEEVARVINSYPGVTHNYLREHPLNMWFTLLAPGEEYLQRIIAEIRERTGIEQIYSLPAEKIFKIKVKFRLSDTGEV